MPEFSLVRRNFVVKWEMKLLMFLRTFKMKFELTTSGNFYSKSDIQKLENLGFKFKDWNNKDSLVKADKYKIGESLIEINSLDELINFVKKYGSIVLDENSIEIYDDYRE